MRTRDRRAAMMTKMQRDDLLETCQDAYEKLSALHGRLGTHMPNEAYTALCALELQLFNIRAHAACHERGDRHANYYFELRQFDRSVVSDDAENQSVEQGVDLAAAYGR